MDHHLSTPDYMKAKEMKKLILFEASETLHFSLVEISINLTSKMPFWLFIKHVLTHFMTENCEPAHLGF